MNKKTQTVDTYNTMAKQMGDKFDNVGARVKDVEETFALVAKTNPNVLEIGCGNGRDAVEISKNTNFYLGIDISTKLIELAREKLPTANFLVADIENYDLPPRLDIIFAFASLIHVPKESLSKILSKCLTSLNIGGVVRMSMKYSDLYVEFTKNDQYGTRTYYLYSDQDIRDLASDFVIIKNETQEAVGQKWLEVILMKK